MSATLSCLVSLLLLRNVYHLPFVKPLTQRQLKLQLLTRARSQDFVQSIQPAQQHGTTSRTALHPRARRMRQQQRSIAELSRS